MVRSNAHRLPLSALFIAAVLLACSGKQVAPTEEGPAPVLAEQKLELDQDVTTFRLLFSGTVASENEATIERAKWEHVIDGEVIKSGEESLNVSVPEGGQAPFQVRAETRYVENAEQLQEFAKKEGSLLTALRGTLFVKSGGKTYELPFGRSREVRPPRMPSVKMHSLDAARYSDEEANIIFYLGIVNPNPFLLGVGGLDYKVTVAGREIASGTRAKAEKVSPSSTGVYELQYPIRSDTMKMDVKEMKALMKAGKLPWVVEGELHGDVYRIPYKLEGTVQLPPPQR